MPLPRPPETSISADELRRVVTYDKETGQFYPKVILSRRWWRVGHPIGSDHPRGYRQINLYGVAYLAHRLAWLYVYGEWPPEELDHKNLDKADNRISNLRLATKSQNQRNIRCHRDTRSGLKGAYWNEECGWYSSIRINNRLVRLGSFDTAEEAHQAYVDAAQKFFGEFARAA